MPEIHVHFETSHARRAHELGDAAPEGYYWLVVAENDAGRPCGWGTARSFDAARAEADRQWNSHSCYPGEVRGPCSVHLFETRS